ncbi:MAG: hypothetical protein OEX14_05125 [Paracoccaceae bacterium]|nr:hypothetical protein [Paracoccaceae bacterium]
MVLPLLVRALFVVACIIGPATQQYAKQQNGYRPSDEKGSEHHPQTAIEEVNTNGKRTTQYRR